MKTVLITGTSGGIGYATAKACLQEGYLVFGLDVVTNDISSPNYHFFRSDLTDISSLEEVKKEVEKISPHLDVILNLAGIFRMQSMLEGKEEDLRQILEVNFFSTYRINKLFFPMLDSSSRIVVFSSEVARYSPQPFNGYYSLSKVIVDRYADILRREYAYLGIRVIKVESGAIKTNLLTGVNDKYKAMVEASKYYQKPLTKLKKLMDNEIQKEASPSVIARLLIHIIKKKKPHICYRVKNSVSLRFLNALPETLQDRIYLKVIR